VSDPQFLTVAELADRWRCCIDTVRVRCMSGQLGAVKESRHWKIPLEGVKAWEAERTPDRAGLDEPAEVVARISAILRQHYAEQSARAAG
jgi:hypothetical protein